MSLYRKADAEARNAMNERLAWAIDDLQCRVLECIPDPFHEAWYEAGLWIRPKVTSCLLRAIRLVNRKKDDSLADDLVSAAKLYAKRPDEVGWKYE